MFIEAQDYKTYIRDQNLQRLIEGDATLLEQAQDIAIDTISTSLMLYYDAATVFAATGADRSKVVVRWVAVLSLYYLYERLPATIMPDRVRDNYKEVMGWLTLIERGDKPANLPTITVAPGTEPATKFRWGSQTARTH
jgi:Protein of unknown function (DUF1320)